MRLINQGAALFALGNSSSAMWPHLRAAAALVPGTAPDEIDRLTDILSSHVLKFLSLRGSGAPLAQIREALEDMVTSLITMEVAIGVTCRAKQGADPRDVNGASLHALYGYVVETVLPGVKLPLWDADDPAQSPHKLKFAQMAQRIAEMRDRLAIDDLDLPNRAPDLAFDRLIGGLATLWQNWAFCSATAASKSSAAGYRSPFAHFIVTLWGAIDAYPPSNATIRRALQRGLSLSTEN
ncbi:hypothetical protein ACT009_11540 [Sphingomonas sp. Tas61C01]|uniref:hypothetical protein n=1 Tax=Sphingomonas sp. Tas61C01 TaxID=3458297 RepID=UPI00403E4C7A